MTDEQLVAAYQEALRQENKSAAFRLAAEIQRRRMIRKDADG